MAKARSDSEEGKGDSPRQLIDEGNTRRAIDIREDDKIDEEAFKALIRAAVEMNTR